MSHRRVNIDIYISLIPGCKISNIDLQVYWIHDIHEWLQGSRIELSLKESLLLVEREFIKLPNQLTTVSAQIGENIQKYYGLMNRTTIVHNCPAFVGEYRPFPDIRSQIGLSAKAALGVYVGNIKPGRGLEDAIRATSSIPELNFALVGRPVADSYREELRELVRFLSIENRVHFFGEVPHQYVSSFISSATFGFQGLPSYPNADFALPNKLFEYMHAKIPVVSSDLFSISDFLSSFSLGMVYQNKNLQSLSKAFIDICRSAEDFNSSLPLNILF
jgi:glycosyltransferase involved in cell wall biosynthesis